LEKFDINELTLGQLKEIQGMLLLTGSVIGEVKPTVKEMHPMLGKRVLVRTYSAGVHIGNVAWVNPENSMEVKLENALRLWKWEGGGLSLSAVANNGINGGRLNKTGEVLLTNVIEFIPTTEAAEATFIKFMED
jgi:hypothetical protein